MNNTEEVLRRVNRYLSLTRYGFATQEKLMRLKAIEDYYKNMNVVATEEFCSGTVESAEQLSKKGFMLPLKVRGVFLTEGRPLRKFYSANEIELATKNEVNQKFPLMLDHKDKEGRPAQTETEELVGTDAGKKRAGPREKCD